MVRFGVSGLAGLFLVKTKPTPAPETAEAPQGDAVVYLLPTEIVADDEWNSRSRLGPGQYEQSDAELEASIREKGLLQPPRVRRLNGAWYLNFGFRRLRACLRIDPRKKMMCTVMPTTGNFDEDDVRARLENLAENGPRLALSAYELATEIRTLRQIHKEKMTFRQIGHCVGKSEEHVERLCRIREKLCPELLDAWKMNPDRFVIKDLLAVAPLVHGDQVVSYNNRLRDRRGGRPKGSKTAKRVNARDIAKWKEEVREAWSKAKRANETRLARLLQGAERALEAVENGVFDIREILK